MQILSLDCISHDLIAQKEMPCRKEKVMQERERGKRGVVQREWRGKARRRWREGHSFVSAITYHRSRVIARLAWDHGDGGRISRISEVSQLLAQLRAAKESFEVVGRDEGTCILSCDPIGLPRCRGAPWNVHDGRRWAHYKTRGVRGVFDVSHTGPRGGMGWPRKSSKPNALSTRLLHGLLSLPTKLILLLAVHHPIIVLQAHVVHGDCQTRIL